MLSYKELMKMIQTYHPLDPIYQKNFSVFDKITIKDYGLKLTDCIGCRHCYSCVNTFIKKCTKCVLGSKDKLKLVKPESMKDVLDSASDTEGEDKHDTYKGLSGAAIHIGEGATLYL